MNVMKREETDVVVVGAGVGGGTVAAEIARSGHRVILCEEHAEVGVPSHCSGHVGISAFHKLGLEVPPNLIENKIRGAVFHSPSGFQFELEREAPVTWVLNRKGFDGYLAKLATSAGAELCPETRVTRLLVEDTSIRAFAQQRRALKQITAQMVVDASGVGSPLARFMGLVEQPPSMFVNSAQISVAEVRDVDLDFVELYFGQNFAPGFFAWIIPRRDGSAKVGVACAGTNARLMLDKFTRTHPVASRKLKHVDLDRATFHPIPVGGAVSRSYAERYLVTGDAAGQVKATTGGGIVFGIICGRAAAKAVNAALSQRNFSARSLSCYEREWRRTLDFDLRVMSLLRRMLYQIPDHDVDRVFRAAARLGAPEILSKGTDDIDFQGRTLLSLAKHHPRLLTAIVYATFRSFPSLLWAALK